MRRAKITMLVALAAACDRGAPPPDPIGVDCTALAQAARRASACDPVLADLADALVAEHDEGRCRRAARALLTTTPPARRIRSLFETQAAHGDAPLGDDERRALLELELPARVTVVPDIAPGPGVPPTSAEIGARALDRDDRGKLEAWIRPGAHALRVRHAGEEARYCIDVAACEELSITAHGLKLAEHPRVRTAPCELDRTETVAARPGR